MNVVVRTSTLDATPAQIWRVLADFAGISGWASNVDHACLMSDQTSGVGMTRRIQTGPLTVLETVVEWEPQQTLAYRLDGMPPVIKSVTNTWSLVPDGDYTVVTLTSHVNAGPRPPQKAIAKAVGKRLAKASDEMLAGLADCLKQGVVQ